MSETIDDKIQNLFEEIVELIKKDIIDRENGKSLNNIHEFTDLMKEIEILQNKIENKISQV
jgi:hypothetical protein